MLSLQLASRGADPLKVLCLGAHSDDIEIGCGGTLLQLQKAGRKLKFHWVVLSACDQRAKEAAAAAELFTGDCEKEVVLQEFRDGFMPYSGGLVKDFFDDRRILSWDSHSSLATMPCHVYPRRSSGTP